MPARFDIRSSSGASSESSRSLYAFLAVWLAVAIAFAVSGAMRMLPPGSVPLLIWSPVIASGVLLWQFPGVRRVIDAIPLEHLVAFHFVRAPIGAAFLVLATHGLLTPKFAIPAGIGDIAAGVLAVPVAFAVQRGLRFGRSALLAWNVLALADILFVFVTAQRILLFGEGPAAMSAFFDFPGPMVPSFVVPLVLITHALIFRRVRQTRSEPVSF